MILKKPHLIKINTIGKSEIGFISIIQNNSQIPFDIKRVYWTHGTPDHIKRGNHAHKDLQQFLVAISGKIRITFEDKNNNKIKFLLDKPSTGVYVPPGYWRTIEFFSDAVLLCLASDNYYENDYIRDYNTFKSLG